MKKKVFFAMLLITFCTTIFAQSAKTVTEVLNSKTVTFSQVSYFAAVYLGLSSDDVSNEESLILLEKAMHFPSITNPQENLSYKDFSYFCTHVWNIESTLLYMLTKAPRYAFRELKLLGYILPTIDPDTLISGQDALAIMTKCADYADAQGTVEMVIEEVEK